MPKRLHIIDGADKGRIYTLPEAGTVIVGNSHKNTDICVHDLLASRVHCEFQVDGDVVTVNDLEDSSGTFVNSQKIKQQPVALNDVIRLGNTFMRLEDAAETIEETGEGGDAIGEADALEVVDDGPD